MRFIRNKYVKALLALMLFSAIVHMLVLAYIALATGNVYALNYFSILSLTYFFPGGFNSFWGNALSLAVIVALYLIFLKNQHNQ